MHVANNHLDSALASTRHAKQLEPTNVPIVRVRVATLLRYSGDEEGAEREIVEALRMDSTNHLLTGERFELNVASGRCDRARSDLASRLVIPQQNARAIVAVFWAICGQRARAMRYADSVAVVGMGDAYVDEFSLAMVWAALGDSAQVYHWLDRAVAQHNTWLFYLRHHWAFREYVGRREYAALMRRAHVQ